ncbi:pantoate--beta-alanine ligase [Taibaiella lutea]|uniref:Pantothenate synthetase n=1 Tax=Taibaiella lutea TaxID=2608001 RepID=A0A5M6CNI2_9BACT|nr:pantoate--beta-alanine ligase [Taibaiella lutea]KAA5536694.1 pantoate--beta-alanine ligase [Taibaiella lutea]
MLIFKSIGQIQSYLKSAGLEGTKIGFVPTMGALHEGHISLIKAAQKENKITVCSIFVNPTQFNNPSDLEKYPRTTEKDIELLHDNCCDVLFLPDVEEMYPDGQILEKQYDLGFVETILEGASRPGHFQGVAQVVEKLLDIIKPDNLYMGQKDYQQIAIVRRLLKLMNTNIQLKTIATTREPDGLAMSSRNKRLTEPQRNIAGLIYQCLVSIQTKEGLQHFSIVKKECEDILAKKGFKPDYVALADAETLEPLEDYVKDRNTVALIAAFIGDVRLIDNLLLN